MKKSNLVVILVVAGILLVVGAVLYIGKPYSNRPAPSSPSSFPSSVSEKSAATITFSDSDFSPASITVKPGDIVTVKNTSSSTVQVQSDPHPTHTDNPDLNIGAIPAGESREFTANRTGKFGYHNHLNSEQKGTVVVR